MSDPSLDDLFAIQNRLGRDPFRRVRKRPILSVDAGVGEANYLLQIPLINLPGRGLDLSLTLYYNSKLWIQQSDPNWGTILCFDRGAGWPAAGWSLGFGRMLEMPGGTVLQDADGTSHPFSSGHAQYYTTDGTLIDYSASWNDEASTGSGLAQYPDGTTVEYGAASYSPNYYEILRAFPTRITDRNGNTIEISYVNNAGPTIQSITDTLGRTVDFVYGNVDIGFGTIRNLLTTIQAPGVNSATREVARFHYHFLNIPHPGDPHYSVPVDGIGFDAIYFPGTSTGYWFDPDSYTGNSGIITKVSQRRAMTLTSTSASDQGITPGLITRERTYNYPAQLDGKGTIPAYTTMTETWAGMNTPEVTTTYTVDTSSSPRSTDTVYPDGSQVTQLMYNHPGQYDDGLLYQVMTYDSAGNLLRQVDTAWEPGDYDSPRIAATEVTDELRQVRATSYSYSSPTNQVTWVNENNYAGSAQLGLRSTRTDYLPDAGYSGRHIFNLPERVLIYDQNNFVVSRTEYQYDGQALLDAPGVPGYQDPATTYRGNITAITRYADAYTPTRPIVETRTYDIAGNMVTQAGATYEQTTYGYDQATGYAYPVKITSGAAGRAVVTRSFTYDKGTGLQHTATDVNGRTTKSTYDNGSLRIQQVTLPAGALIEYSYDDEKMTATRTAYTAPGNVAGQATTSFNGLGLVQGVITGLSPTWTGVATEYDALGRPSAYSQPYPLSPAGTPTIPAIWTHLTRDALGRVTSQQAPDGSTTTWHYNEPQRPGSASGLPGQTVRVQSPAINSEGTEVPGADMWYRTDALGNLAEVVEPSAYGTWPGGSVFSAGNVKTAYSYNALGLLVQVSQGAKANGARFQYDSLGRLTAQYWPEKAKTLDNTGAYAGADGEWSDVFTYDQRSNLTSRTDTRGVKKIYDYSATPGGSADPLNRVYKISYQNTGPADTTIEPTSGISYAYMPAGDITRIRTVTTSPVATNEAVREYAYNADGLVTSDQLTWPKLGASPQPLRADYSYDTLGRLVTETYPAEYGSGKAGGFLRLGRWKRRSKTVSYGYNTMGQLASVQVNGADYASGLGYNPAGQATTITVGPAGPQQTAETYEYDPATNLLSSQQITSLLHIDYTYWPNRQLYQRNEVQQLPTGVNRNRQVVYSYDAVGRLWKMDVLDRIEPLQAAISKQPPPPAGWSEEYTFDEYGNRTTVTASGGVPPDGLPLLTYDPQTNHIASAGFTYDLAGNLTRGQRADGSWLRYRYDQAGRVVSVTSDSGQPIESYGYGADGKRLLTRRATGSTYFAWSRARLIAEYTHDASQSALRWSASRIYLGNRTLASFRPGKTEDTVFYQHPDRLGTRLVTDTSNNTTWDQATLPFGTLTPETSRWINPLFTTYDAGSIPSLYYAVNRTYDSELRFTQPDPIGLAAVDTSHPQTLNLYSYANNDPVNSTDLTGLQPDAGTGTGTDAGRDWYTGTGLTNIPDAGIPTTFYGGPTDPQGIQKGLWELTPDVVKAGIDILSYFNTGQLIQIDDPVIWSTVQTSIIYQGPVAINGEIVSLGGPPAYVSVQTTYSFLGVVSTGTVLAQDFADGSSSVYMVTPDGTVIDRETDSTGQYTETVYSPDGTTTNTTVPADPTVGPDDGSTDPYKGPKLN